MSDDLVAVSLRVPRGLHDRLKHEARRRDLGAAVLVRKALELYLDGLELVPDDQVGETAVRWPAPELLGLRRPS